MCPLALFHGNNGFLRLTFANTIFQRNMNRFLRVELEKFKYGLVKVQCTDLQRNFNYKEPNTIEDTIRGLELKTTQDFMGKQDAAVYFHPLSSTILIYD